MWKCSPAAWGLCRSGRWWPEGPAYECSPSECWAEGETWPELLSPCCCRWRLKGVLGRPWHWRNHWLQRGEERQKERCQQSTCTRKKNLICSAITKCIEFAVLIRRTIQKHHIFIYRNTIVFSVFHNWCCCEKRNNCPPGKIILLTSHSRWQMCFLKLCVVNQILCF